MKYSNRTKVRLLVLILSVLFVGLDFSQAQTNEALLVSITPSSGKIVSGQTVRFDLNIPSGIGPGRISLYCPEGVTSSGGTTDTDLCNTNYSFESLPKIIETTLINSKDWPQYVVANLYGFYKNNQVESLQATAEITVLPVGNVNNNSTQNKGIISRVFTALTDAASILVNSVTNILLPNSGARPKVSLAISGGHEKVYAVGETVKYSWSATNADILSFASVSNNPDKCGAFDWIPSEASGTFEDTANEIDDGCAWTITYTGQNSQNGRSVSDSIRLAIGQAQLLPITNTVIGTEDPSLNGSQSQTGGTIRRGSSGGSTNSSAITSPTIKPLPPIKGRYPYPTWSPSVTVSSSPTPTATAKPSVTTSPSNSPIYTPTPTPTIYTTPSPTIYSTPTPTITATPSSSVTPTPSVTVSPSSTPTPSLSPTPTQTSTPTPTYTPSPTSSISPTASPTGTPTSFFNTNRNQTAAVGQTLLERVVRAILGL